MLLHPPYSGHSDMEEVLVLCRIRLSSVLLAVRLIIFQESLGVEAVGCLCYLVFIHIVCLFVVSVMFCPVSCAS